MSYITSTWLGSQYARKWAISSIIVDLWEKKDREESRNRGLLVVGWFLDVSREEGGGLLAGRY